MRSPFSLITSSQRRLIDPTKFINVLSGILPHSSIIKLSSSPRFFGNRLSTFPLTIHHKFSMGFRSGLFDGQSITAGTFSCRNPLARRLVCFGSLSCWSLHSSPSILRKQNKVVLPTKENPPHARIFVRSFGRGRIGRTPLYQRLIVFR